MHAAWCIVLSLRRAATYSSTLCLQIASTVVCANIWQYGNCVLSLSVFLIHGIERSTCMFFLFTAWKVAVIIKAATLGNDGDLDLAQWLLSCCHTCRVRCQLTRQWCVMTQSGQIPSKPILICLRHEVRCL